jgi:putative ABC transport system permease protein
VASGGLVRLAPLALPRGETIGIDVRALLFTAAVALGAGLLVGIVPALRAGRDGGAGTLRAAGRGGMVGRGTHRLQRVLVVAQVALALVLLVGAALLVGSLSRLLSVDPGFEPAGVLAVHVSLPESRYPERADVGRFFDELIGRVDAIPGVERAGAVWALPLTNVWASGGAYPEGEADAEAVAVGMLPVRGAAFEALGMRLVAGRTYSAADLAPVADVVVINETMARRFWPGEDAVGKRFRRSSRGEAGDRPWLTVIGVMADVKRASLGTPSDAEAFFHHGHTEGGWASDMRIVVRAAADPLALAAPIRAAVRALDPALAVGDIVTLPQLIERSAAGPRIRTLLSTTFAALAALLAVIGIYGVMAFAVNERRREIGVRMALGARRGDVLGGVLRQGGTLVAAGIALGLIGAAAATRLIASLLFGVSALDVRIYGATAALLALVALAACAIPAVRAARVDPLIALREE